MPYYEYIVVAAPEKAPRVKGLKGTARFAYALQEVMNDLAQDGWEYLRAESLPDTERKGFMGGSETVTRNVLVFRREIDLEEPAEPQPARLAVSQPPAPRAPVRAVQHEAPDSDEGVHAAADMPKAEGDAQTPVFRRPLVAERPRRASED
jgi:hypothetical protein